MRVDSAGFEDLLKGKNRYNLLKNQRRYAWEEKQITQFVKDVESVYNETGQRTKQHFFGPMVFAKKGSRLTVIDGQQRLATVGIFLCVIRDMLFDEGKHARAKNVQNRLRFEPIAGDSTRRITLGRANDEFYKDYIMNEQSAKEKITILEGFKKEKGPNYWLAYAYCEFYSKIKEWTKRKTLRSYDKLLSIVLKIFVVIRIVINTHEYAFKIFETLNDRGVKLRKSDLVKSYFIEYCDHRKRDDINKAWERMIDELNGINSDEYLRYFWIANRELVSKRDLVESMIKHIKKNNTEARIAKCVNDLLEQTKTYYALHYPEMERRWWGDADLVKDLRDLNTLNAKLVKIVLLKAKARSINKKDYRRLAHMLICFFFRSKIICNVHASEIECVMANIAKEIRHSKINFKKIKILLNDEKIYPSDKEFYGRFVIKKLSQKIQRYTLLQLELKNNPESDVEPIDQITVEHIMPKMLSPNWKHVNDSDHKQLLNTIGNLTLLGPKDNTRAGNKPWRYKRDKVYKNSRIKITNSIAKSTKWRKKEIEDRTNKFAKLALQIWKV